MSDQPEKRVTDIMIPLRSYKIISKSCKIEDAVKVLYRAYSQRTKGGAGHRSVIVCDDYGNPVGLITFRSVLQALEPFFAKAQNLSVPVFWEGLFSERCRSEAVKSVEEIMHPISLITLDANDTLIKAAHAMIKHKLGTLPVIKNNRIVGMVRVNEVFEEVHNCMINVEDMENAVIS
ncbi:CBS domain-containing protein [Desulfotomaculum arcticum]|uniref:CBS domain-containing protein n=1 Tax=Desulfotruncus arcticus DSM 17038 TaxID=1121424 RepID=A0A1I3A067_9FIRM|nr:CBS domain-containing protein [Desulfotruncus arcticus]SFH43280.1 CBS domain-containing protein [Desulfotomaculum arcticum] [Desulfotruncus arcticus DSM 17038]